MIPTLFTASVMFSPGGALISSGYVAGNALGAQHFNWYLYHLTAELNNLLIAGGISQSVADDTQVEQAVNAMTLLTELKGETITGSKTYSAFAQDWRIVVNNAGAAAVDITSGASAVGVRVSLDQIGAGVTTLSVTTGAATVTLGIGELVLEWNGTAWVKIGGQTFRQLFTSGTAATWKTPWFGVFDISSLGGGGGGGGCRYVYCGMAGGGGQSGCMARSKLKRAAGVAFTYTIGTGGAGGTGSANGTTGNDTTVTDGVVTLTGKGGIGGEGRADQSPSAGMVQNTRGGGGNVATGGEINSAGQNGYAGNGCTSNVSGSSMVGGAGGSNEYGQGAVAVSGNSNTDGNNALGPGGGGGGSISSSTPTNGGNGLAGLVEILF